MRADSAPQLACCSHSASASSGGAAPVPARASYADCRVVSPHPRPVHRAPERCLRTRSCYTVSRHTRHVRVCHVRERACRTRALESATIAAAITTVNATVTWRVFDGRWSWCGGAPGLSATRSFDAATPQPAGAVRRFKLLYGNTAAHSVNGERMQFNKH